jgi:hypothetical protein
MKLTGLIESKTAISVSTLSDDKELSRDLQKHLIRLGVLDPPFDGMFGPASVFAGRQFIRLVNGDKIPVLDFQLAGQLVDAVPETLLPVETGRNLAGAIWNAMIGKKYWLARIPGYVNIVYLEGANGDGTPNANKPNGFNDLRIALTVQDGKPVVLGKWEATTEPGKFYTENPMNPMGAARIAFGQYKAWSVGTHGSAGGAHQALVQCGEIRVHRDLNKDFKRDNDAVDTGSSFAVNQHWGYDLPVEDIGRASAGCLVGRTREGHKKFMSILKEDPRFKANNGYRFMTAILTAQDIQPFLG